MPEDQEQKAHRGPKASVRFNSERLKEVRSSLGWTVSKLAEESGYSEKTVLRAESGHHRTQIQVARDICGALNRGLKIDISLDDLVLPDHADVYRMAGENKFVRDRNRWIEYKGDEVYAVYDELMIGKSYLILACTRRTKEGRSMLIRIPLEGGEVEWTWENELEWEPFTVATKKS
jgi:transcriptional regulator with XRE-family HTH domain